MDSRNIVLISNGTATGSWQGWGGGPASFIVEATDFDSATATLQFKAPTTDTAIAVDSTNLVLSANGMVYCVLPPGDYRCVVAGGTPTAMYARLMSVEQAG